MHWVVFGVLLTAFWLPTQPLWADTDTPAVREYKIKAAYIYNLLKFVNWPEPGASEQTSITICILQHNPFNGYLDRLTERVVRGKPIYIQQLEKTDSTNACNVLFISKKIEQQEATITALNPIDILTVGEDSDFINRGGLFALVVADNSVQLEINLSKAKENGFEISGNLLEIAKTIK